ncbi:MAG TPA: hypothetical protein VLL98_02580 [Rickettsiales bacterium]|nr:hypothetical protein [Rickettsiales bacterium]
MQSVIWKGLGRGYKPLPAREHEQIFLEDGKEDNNYGYFDDGTVRADKDENLGLYTKTEGGYDDEIMRQAIKNVELQDYSLLGIDGNDKFNCQDFATEVRKEYYKIYIKNLINVK